MPSEPWTCRASTGSSRSGRAAPDADGDVARDRRVSSTVACCGRRPPAGALPPDARDGAQVEPGLERGEEEGAGVVDAGVDVEDDGDRGHGDDHGRCPGPGHLRIRSTAGGSRSVVG